jgi:hypothetical protein
VNPDLFILIVLLAASTVACAVAARPVTDHQLSRWSIRFNVLLEDSAKPSAARQLRRARSIRTVSLVAGINVGALPIYMNVIDVERAAFFSNNLVAQAPFAAAAIGAVIAEFSLVRRPRGVRSATLQTRRWSDYIERSWFVGIAACLPVSMLAAAIAITRSDSDPRWVWASPLACVVAILATTLGVHIVVNRPAVLAGERVRRIDDAFRADGAHHVVGAAFALAGVATCYSLTAAVGGWLGLLTSLLTYAVLGNWYGIARLTRWNVDQARLQHA